MKSYRARAFVTWGLIFTTAMVCVVVKFRVEQSITYPLNYHPSVKPIEARYRSESLKKYSMGFDNFLASLMWIQLLQYSSHLPIQDSNVSWEFVYVDAITELDPNFQLAFSFGATFLSVFKQDKLGGALLLEKWVKQRPHFWRANYLLGFHYFSEMDDPKRGADYILKAAKMEGAPSWVSSLGVRMLSETGALAQALKLSIELYPGIRDYEGKYRLKRRIRSLNYHLQRQGWELALKKYIEEKQQPPSKIQDLRPWLQSEVRDISSVFQEGVPEEVEGLLSEAFPFSYDARLKKIVPQFDDKAEGLDVVGIMKNPSLGGKQK